MLYVSSPVQKIYLHSDTALSNIYNTSLSSIMAIFSIVCFYNSNAIIY